MQLQATDLPGRLPAQPQAAYLVIGDEPLLVQESAAAVRSRLVEQGFAERIVLHPGAGFDWAELPAQGGAMSLFCERRLLEIELPNGKPGTAGATAIGDFLKAPPADTALLLVAQTDAAPPRDAAWVKKVHAQGVVVSCRPLKSSELMGWLDQRLRKAGLRVSREAVQWLGHQVEGNLLAAVQEIAKLPLLELSGEIGLEQMRGAISDSARFAVFDLSDTALSGNLPAALRTLQRLREEGVEPVVLVSIFARDLRSLHAAALHAPALGSERACERAGIWRIRVRSFRAALGRHDVASTQAMLQMAARLDRVAKSAPAGRAWEDLLNLTVRLAAPEFGVAA